MKRMNEKYYFVLPAIWLNKPSTTNAQLPNSEADERASLLLACYCSASFALIKIPFWPTPWQRFTLCSCMALGRIKTLELKKLIQWFAGTGIAVIRAVNATYIYRMLLYYPFDSLPFFGTLEIYISEVLWQNSWRRNQRVWYELVFCEHFSNDFHMKLWYSMNWMNFHVTFRAVKPF